MNVPRPMTVLEEAPALFTSEEFIALAARPPISDWPGKIELVQGVITRLSPAHIPHWNAQRVVHARLYDALRDVAGGWIVGFEPAVRLAGDTVRVPDVALLRDPGLSGEMFDSSALFLAIEIADTSLDIDLGPKRLTYARSFVQHYWVVDIKGRVVHVLADPREGDYRRQDRRPFGSALDVPGTDRTIVID